MPTYQYRCSTCDNRFDAFQKFSEDPLTDCPVCGGSVRRVIQPVGVVFKGTGWYINDSRKKPSDSGDTDTKGKAAESKATESKPAEPAVPKDTAETKPAVKTETKAASAAD